ncbi:MAG TPA: DUF6585 family protein [Ktedonobacteraceae bacterium]|nr:DUF6585 family protein [Ktedonobacteraceae bacterium]
MTFQQQPAQQVPTFSPEAYQVAVTYNLGIPITEYRPKFTTRKAIGQISLNQQAMSNGKEELAWQQVKGIKFNQGSLFLQKEDSKWRMWNNIHVSQIPNVNEFLALVDSIINSGRREIS